MTRKVDEELKRASQSITVKAKKYAAWDTGMMSTSIYRWESKPLTYEVVSPMFYSWYVEAGTRKQRAQPFLFPALKEEEHTLWANLRRIVK